MLSSVRPGIRTAHVNEGLELGLGGGEDVREGSSVGGLAAIHVVHVRVKRRVNELLEGFSVSTVSLDVLCVLLASLEILR